MELVGMQSILMVRKWRLHLRLLLIVEGLLQLRLGVETHLLSLSILIVLLTILLLLARHLLLVDSLIEAALDVSEVMSLVVVLILSISRM